MSCRRHTPRRTCTRPSVLQVMLGFTLAMVLGLAGCGQQGGEPDNATGSAAPTVASPFGAATAALSDIPTSALGPAGTAGGGAETTPVARPTQPMITEEGVYDEELDPSWSLAHSWGMRYDLHGTAQVESGEVAMTITPQEDYGGLLFTLMPTSTLVYSRAEVVGLSFWLSSDQFITPQDLAITVLGSNTYPYWVEGDDSAAPGQQEIFSETRLMYFDIQHDIPAGKWIEITVKLDKLGYDPLYTFVTGFYIKNDKDYRNPFYVDRVVMLVAR
jgi:hypothetical protein